MTKNIQDQRIANEDEWVDIVDENNHVILQATRQQMRDKNLCHRATYIIVHNGANKVLVQQRSPGKDYYPGWLDAAAGGVVQSGEDLLDSARREAQEELGITDVPLAEHELFYFESEFSRVWGALFSCVSHGPFALQNEEIDQVSWMTLEEIEQDKRQFTPDSLLALKLWAKHKQQLG